MFVATLNKTLKSYIFAIVGAEYILRWLPIGTHEWEKFVNPDDLIAISLIAATNQWEGIFNAVSPQPVSQKVFTKVAHLS